MQLTRESTSTNVIRAWEAGRIMVGVEWLRGNVIVSADAIVRDWMPADPWRLDVGDLKPAIDLDPEIVVLGTGSESATPDTKLMAELAGLNIGLEIMSTPAACRTYNVLLHEQRRVVAALFAAASPG